ncbi:hypothetical protein [Candidatus Lokiarchaeum ossiferum]|uniref:hypothetical protein n=1 Tax=Candidatus Lokiarchaeum ossiferum TaxID=2951803 RepID=UPI00352EC5B9
MPSFMMMVTLHFHGLDIMNNEKFKMTLPEIILVALMSALNAGFDLLLSPPLKVLFGHIVAGIFLMVPINFIFITFTKLMVNKHGTATIFLTIFATISIPTAMFGGVPGAYKILIGAVIGICLDLIFSIKNKIAKIIAGGILGAVIWWITLFTIWQLFKFPFVTGFSNLLNAASPNFAESIDLSNIIQLPITGFGGAFFAFATLCGLLSAIPCVIGGFIGFGLFRTIEKTALYEKFQNMQ